VANKRKPLNEVRLPLESRPHGPAFVLRVQPRGPDERATTPVLIIRDAAIGSGSPGSATITEEDANGRP
jgi:hypothetical protein